MNSKSDTPKNGRREFLATGARLFAVGGMAAFATAQARKGDRLADDPNCIKLFTCSDCIELPNGCQLPKANTFRADNPDATPPRG